jgi:hypothetical protein
MRSAILVRAAIIAVASLACVVYAVRLPLRDVGAPGRVAESAFQGPITAVAARRQVAIPVLVPLAACPEIGEELRAKECRPCEEPVMRQVLSQLLHSHRRSHSGFGFSFYECGPTIPSTVVDEFMTEWSCSGTGSGSDVSIRDRIEAMNRLFPRDLVRHNKTENRGGLMRFVSNDWHDDGEESFVQFGWPYYLDDDRVLLPECAWVQSEFLNCTAWSLRDEGDGFKIVGHHDCCGIRVRANKTGNTTED